MSILIALLLSNIQLEVLITLSCAVSRLDEEEEGKRVAHLAEVLNKLSQMSNEVTF